MAKHTPGPWYSAYSKTNEFGGGNIRSDHHVDGSGALLLVAGGMFHDYEVDREEDIANLHLAAAAPELLEALEALVGIAEDDHYKCDLDFVPALSADCWLDQVDKHDVMRRAKQAIAKATGGGA